MKDRILVALAPRLAGLIIKLIALTMKIEIKGEENIKQFWDVDRKVIIAFWHGRLLMMPLCYKGKGINILISQHKDGELIAKTMECFGFGSVRGSSTRGGATAMREMVRSIRRSDIAITPDGPRGPRYVVQDGIIFLARLSGAPIIPLTFCASRRKIFASWDAFNLPFPFSRGVFLWGEPIYVSSEDDIETKRSELENRMREMTEMVDELLRDKD